MKNALKLFDFSGTPVYLKYWFLILFIFLSFKTIIVAFISVLIHEMAHAWVAKRLGYNVEKIYIDIFHGAAEIDQKHQENYNDSIKIVAAGPLSNLILCLIFTLLFVYVDFADPILIYVKLMIIINLFLAIFNLLPIYPLDGGRITKALFKKHLGEIGQKYSGILSLIFSILLLSYSLFAFDWILIIFSIIFVLFSYYEINNKD